MDEKIYLAEEKWWPGFFEQKIKESMPELVERDSRGEFIRRSLYEKNYDKYLKAYWKGWKIDLPERYKNES